MYSFIKGFALVKNSLHFHDRSALGIIHKLKQFAVPFEIYPQSPPNLQSLQVIHCSLAELTNSPSHSSHLLTQYTTTQTSPPASSHHPQAERNYSFSPDIIFPKICFAWKKGGRTLCYQYLIWSFESVFRALSQNKNQITEV